MEKVNTDKKNIEKALTPPEESRASIIMNGVGNGMMIGVTPFVFVQSGFELANKNVPKAVTVFNILATLGGMVWGAQYGIREANRVGEYRKTVSDGVSQLREEMRKQSAEVATLREQVNQQSTASGQYHTPGHNTARRHGHTADMEQAEAQQQASSHKSWEAHIHKQKSQSHAAEEAAITHR